jgi:UDP-2,4-diacetamido-2,4,6-trideoxy-beta-L-altropyranose hydrolase
MKTIIFRVDVNLSIGQGHMSRCLAFASVLKKDNYKIIFITATSDDQIAKLQRENQHEFKFIAKKNINSTEEIKNIIGKVGDLCLFIIDGYNYTEKYLRFICKHNFKTLELNELGDSYCGMDFVLNQNLGAEYLYSQSSKCKYLIGPEFLLLRDEFFETKIIHPNKKFQILISFGGSEQSSRVNSLLKSLSTIKEETFHITILLGGTSAINLNKNVLELFHDIKLVGFIDNPSSEFIKSDLIICPSGSTIWELCMLNKPFLTFSLIDNQNIILRAVEKFDLGQTVDFENLNEVNNKVKDIILNPGLCNRNIENQRHIFKNAGLTLKKFNDSIGKLI